MRLVFTVGLKSDPLHDPLVLRLKLHELCHCRNRRHDGARPVAPERVETVDAKSERRPFHHAEQIGDFLRQRIVDVADKAQG
jgi:hypothetical protein